MSASEYYRVAVVFEAPPYRFENYDGEGAHVEWDFIRTRSREADVGIVTVSNMPVEVHDEIRAEWSAVRALGKVRATVADFATSAAEFVGLGTRLDPALRELARGGPHYRVRLSFGWGGRVSPLFESEVIDIRPSSRAPETEVQFVLGDGALTLRDAQLLGMGFAAQTVDVVISFIVNTQLSTRIEPQSKQRILERAAELPIQRWNNYVVMGDPTDRLDELIETLGLEWKIHNGLFIVMDKGVTASQTGESLILTEESGLLDAYTIEDGGVQAVALADADMSPGVQFQVRAHGRPVGAQHQRCDTVHFVGVSGQDSTMTVRGQRAVLV